MPIKGQSPKEVVHTEMHKFKYKQLHSGSNKGPLVKDRKQAIAIALSESRRAGKKYAEGGATDLPDVGDPLVGGGGEFSPGTRLGNKAADIGSKLGYGVTTNAATMPYRIMKNMVEGSQESMAGDGVGELSPKSVQGAGDLIMQGLGNAAGARPGSPAAPGVFVGPYGAHMLRDADRNLTQPHPVIGEEINQRASSLRPEFRDIYKGAAQDMRDAQARGVLEARQGSRNTNDTDVFYGSGWSRGEDGLPRKEIPDTGAKLVPIKGGGGFELQHPAGNLHQIYDVPPIKFDPKMKSGIAAFYPSTNNIVLGGSPTPTNLKDSVGSALHEFQHAIQKKEGFAKGANPEHLPSNAPVESEYFPGSTTPPSWWNGAVDNSGNPGPGPNHQRTMPQKAAEFEAYHRSAGETESRNVEARLAQSQKYQSHPSNTEDVSGGLQWIDPANMIRKIKDRKSSGGEVSTHSINPMNDVTDPDVHPLGSAAGGPRASLHMAAKGLLTRPHVHKQDLGAGDESKVYDKGDSADEDSPAPKAGGGSTGNFNPERASAIGLTRQGMINSAVPGRTDKLNLNVPNGSYIIPADIPSALGQGNSMAGSAILNKMFNSGPYGMNLSKGHSVAPRHSSLSFSSKQHFAEGGAAGDDYNTQLSPMEEKAFQLWRAKNMPNDSGVDYDQRGAYQAGLNQQPNGHWEDQFKKPNHPTFSDQSMYAPYAAHGTWTGDQGDIFVPPSPMAKGGKAGGVAPIVAAGGEYVIHPQTVAQLGNGDLNLGHDILDQFVKQVREKHISTLKSLKPPKGSK